METSASCEARSAPSSYPTGPLRPNADLGFTGCGKTLTGRARVQPCHQFVMRHPALAAEVRFFRADLADESRKSVPQGLKAREFSIILAARLNPCPSSESFSAACLAPGFFALPGKRGRGCRVLALYQGTTLVCSDASCHSCGCKSRRWKLPSCHRSDNRRRSGRPTRRKPGSKNPRGLDANPVRSVRRVNKSAGCSASEP
jgi:hypothetical protein